MHACNLRRQVSRGCCSGFNHPTPTTTTKRAPPRLRERPSFIRRAGGYRLPPGLSRRSGSVELWFSPVLSVPVPVVPPRPVEPAL